MSFMSIFDIFFVYYIVLFKLKNHVFYMYNIFYLKF